MSTELAFAEDYSASTSSQTFALDCTGASILLVFVSLNLETAISSITYNGAALSLLIGQSVPGGSVWRSELWGLLDPATGSNNVIITHGGTVTPWAVASCWSGYDGFENAVGVGSGSGSSTTDTVTSASGDLVVGGFGCSGRDPVVGADQSSITSRSSVNDNTGMVSEEAGAASVTFSHTWTLSRANSQVAVSLTAVAAGGAITPRSIPRAVQRGVTRGVGV